MKETLEVRPSYNELIDSQRVSERTREMLLERLQTPEEQGGAGLSEAQKHTLQAIADCVVPMIDRHIDFASRLDVRLAQAKGKGWRYAVLLQDLEAYRSGLDLVEGFSQSKFGESFAMVAVEQQVETLRLVERGSLRLDGQPMDGAMMQRWFEDVRGDVTEIYMSHPETLARLGYSGIADGANSNALTGFVTIGLGEVESWEPTTSGEGE